MPQTGEVRRQGSAPASGSEDGDHCHGWGGDAGTNGRQRASAAGGSTSSPRRLRAGRRVRVDGRHGLVLDLALVFTLGEAGDGRDALPFLQADQAHALSVAADHADLVHAQADHLPTARDQHDLVVVRHHANADHAAGFVGGLHGDDALPAAPRETVLLHLGALTVAVLGHREQRGAGLHQVERDHLVPRVELHAPHAVVVAAHRPGLVLLEADRLAVARGGDRLARAVRQANADHLVALLERDGDDARGPGARVLHEIRLLDQAATRREEHVAPFLELAHGQEGRELLLRLQAEHVRDAPPAPRAAGRGDLVDLQPDPLPRGGEKREVGARGDNEEVLDEVCLGRAAPDPAAPAAALRAVEGHGIPLDVALVRDGDHHVLFDDQVLDRDGGGLVHDPRAPLVAVLLAQRAQLVGDDLRDLALVGEDGAVAHDRLLGLGVLRDDLVALETGQALEAHVEDGLRLELREREGRHQALARGGGVDGGADDADRLVQVLDRDLEASQDVEPLLGLAQIVDRAADDDLAAVLQEHLQRVLQAEQLRPPLDDRQHVHAERFLQRRVLVELVQQHLGDRVALELDHDAHAVAVGLVAQAVPRDAVELPLAHQLGDLPDETRLVHLVRDLGHDDGRAAGLLVGLDRRPGTDREDAPSLAIRLADRTLPADEAGGREVRPGNVSHQLVDGQLGVLDQRHQRIAHLTQVVGRDVGGHADGYPGRAIDEQVRNLARQADRLLRRVVEIGDEIDGLLVDVGKQLLGQLRQTALGVAVGRRRGAVDRAEIALPADEWIADVPLLRQADQRIVHRRITVRVVALQDLAHHAGALGVAAIVDEPLAEHGVEDAAVDRLPRVARVPHGTPGYYPPRAIHAR